MPIITTLEITRSSVLNSRRKVCSANQSCDKISPLLKLRLNPWWPVEQKRHPTAHPACEEMHKVPRSSLGIKTVSTASPFPTSNSHLTVPSAESCRERGLRGAMCAEVLSFSRRLLAKSDMASKSWAPFWWIQRKSWVARKRFSPSCSQKTAKPSRSKSSRLAVMGLQAQAGLRRRLLAFSKRSFLRRRTRFQPLLFQVRQSRARH